MPILRRVNRKVRWVSGLGFGVAVITIALIMSLPVLGPQPNNQRQAGILPAATSQEVDEATAAGTPTPQTSSYPLHENIITTVFWIGETPSNDNGQISNLETEWDPDPVKRLGYNDSIDLVRLPSGHPVGRTPSHNDFYVALPLGEFNESGPVAKQRASSYWASEATKLTDDESLFKGRWVSVTHKGKMALLQIVDTGPFTWSDPNYVWGSAKPSNTAGLGAGLDVSPAVASYLGIDGSATVNWQFIDASAAAKIDGPWHDFAPISNKIFW
jgi:hypothetical protein